jgi:DNA-binding NarL/FixJ family response regulator
VAEDRDDLRSTLLRRLRFFHDVEVVLTAADGAELVDGTADLPVEDRPEVILMDLEMEGMDGVTATAAVRARWPEIAVVVLTVFDDDRRIGDALAAGAAGYLLKDEPADAIVGAVLEAVSGGTPVSGGVARVLVRRVREQEQARRSAEAALAAFGLTEREREVLTLLATGGTDEDIGQRLFISPHTVQSHTKSLYRKLGVSNRAAATRIAAAHGLT